MLKPVLKELGLGLSAFTLLAACGGGGGGSSAPENQQPSLTLNHQTVAEQSQVTLNAQASDQDGSIASYLWQQSSGPSVTLSNTTASSLSFTAPSVSSTQELVFKLTVTDDDGASVSKSVSVLVEDQNQAPTVYAGGTQSVDEGQLVQLNGTASDSDGAIASTLWQQVSGPTVTLQNATSLSASFTAPDVSSKQTLTFSLSVTDDQGKSQSQTVAIEVNAISAVIPEPDRAADLQLYTFGDLPPGAESNKFTVAINGTPLTVLQTTPPPLSMSVDINPAASDGADSYRSSNRSFAWSQFSFDASASAVDVTITKTANAGNVTDILVRPTQLEGTAYQVISKDLASKTIVIRVLQSNRKLSVEYKDNRYAKLKDLPQDALLLFADQKEADDIAPLPNKTGRNTYVIENGDTFDADLAKTKSIIYFGPGTHDLGYWEVPASVSHVYLAGGAYVLGAINADHNNGPGTGFTISGRGVISGENFPWRADKRTDGATVTVDDQGFSDGDSKNGIKLLDAEQDELVIEGLTVVNVPFYAFGAEPDTRNSWGKISNIKMLGMWRYNNDGFNVGDNVVLDDCFVAPMDDAFKMYRSGATVRDCVVWQMDNGGMFQFGWFPKTVDNVLIENIHAIHTEWTGLNKNRGLANLTERPNIDTRNGTISNVTFRNIWMEGPTSRVIYLRNEYYQNQSYRNWLFENIHVDYMPTYSELVTIKGELGGNGQLNSSLLLNAIEDYDTSPASIKEIRFKNFNLNGTLITDSNAQTTGLFDRVEVDSPTDVSFSP